MMSWRLLALSVVLVFTIAAFVSFQWPDFVGHLPGWLTLQDKLLAALAALVSVLVAVSGLLVWLWRHLSPRLPPIGARRRYLRWLLDRRQYLDFKGMGVTDKVAFKLPLRDLYIPLQARLERPEGEAWERNLELAGRSLGQDGDADAQRLGDRQPVLDLLARHNGLVLLGDPGAGKTTFLRWLAVSIAGRRLLQCPSRR